MELIVLLLFDAFSSRKGLTQFPEKDKVPNNGYLGWLDWMWDDDDDTYTEKFQTTLALIFVKIISFSVANIS